MTGPKPHTRSVTDVARFYSVTTRTVRRWMEDGGIPYIKFRGVIRFNMEDVAKWMDGVGGGEKGVTEPVEPAA